jgi:hypothetical protein
MLAYHAVAVEPEGAARELAGTGVGGEGQAVRQRGPHQVRVAEQRDVPVLVVRGDRRGDADDEDVGAVAVGLLLLLPAVITALLGDERQDLLPEVDQDDLLAQSQKEETVNAATRRAEAGSNENSKGKGVILRGGAGPRCRRRCPPARPSTAGTSPCWRPGGRRGAAPPSPSTRTAAAAPGARGPAASCS